MNRILIAEDNASISSFIEKGLRAGGYATMVIADGVGALSLAKSGAFDLMILDLGLPGLDGTNVIRELRGSGNRIPIVVLTARTEPVEVLNAGADDYVVKPFRFDELVARVKARLRSHGTRTEDALDVGGAMLDLRTRTLMAAGKSHELSSREYRMAEVFFRHPGQVLSRQQLLSAVWGYDFDPSSNIVDVYVGYLRKKIGGGRIQTVRGMGYRLVVSEHAGANHDTELADGDISGGT